MPLAPKIPNWQSFDTSSGAALCGGDPSPVATTGLLVAAVQWPVWVGLTYAQPALLCENSAAWSGTKRRFGAVVGPACVHGRLWFWHGSLSAPVVENTLIGSTTSGFTGADQIKTQAVGIGKSSDKINDNPAVTMDRAIELPESLAPAVEEIEIQHTSGVCLEVTHRSVDLEQL